MRIYILLAALLISVTPARSQILVDTSVSVIKLVRDEFLQGGVEIEHIVFKGNKKALGLFECTSDLFPLSKGILLSTGDAASIMGPNNDMGISGENHVAGDTDLVFVSRGTTYDAAIIEFDFIPASENVAFDFVFASEEYPEYVNSPFNDVFAFIVTDKETGDQSNIAFLPRTHQPITVNNVNHLENTQYYLDNPTPISNFYLLEQRLGAARSVHEKKKKKKDDGYAAEILPCSKPLCKMLQYDGLTTLLTAKVRVVPDRRYHFKIAIADVHDSIYDSSVILRAHSFKSYDRYGYIKGDTSGFRVMDEDLQKETGKERETAIRENRKTEVKDTLFQVLFQTDSYSLSDSAEKILNKVVEVWKMHAGFDIWILGHTDSIGSMNYNQQLSFKRNGSVVKRLAALGVAPANLHTQQFGEMKPAADNGSGAGRALNRRVDIYIRKKQ